MARQDSRHQAAKEENLLDRSPGALADVFGGITEQVVAAIGEEVGSNSLLQRGKEAVDRFAGIKGTAGASIGMIGDFAKALGLYEYAGIRPQHAEILDRFFEAVGRAGRGGTLTQGQVDIAKQKALEEAALIAKIRRQFVDALKTFEDLETARIARITPRRFVLDPASGELHMVGQDHEESNAGEILRRLLREMSKIEGKRELFALYEPELYEAGRIELLRPALGPNATVDGLLGELVAVFKARKPAVIADEVFEIKAEIAKGLKLLRVSGAKWLRGIFEHPETITRDFQEYSQRASQAELAALLRERASFDALAQKSPDRTYLGLRTGTVALICLVLVIGTALFWR